MIERTFHPPQKAAEAILSLAPKRRKSKQRWQGKYSDDETMWKDTGLFRTYEPKTIEDYVWQETADSCEAVDTKIARYENRALQLLVEFCELKKYPVGNVATKILRAGRKLKQRHVFEIRDNIHFLDASPSVREAMSLVESTREFHEMGEPIECFLQVVASVDADAIIGQMDILKAFVDYRTRHAMRIGALGERIEARQRERDVRLGRIARERASTGGRKRVKNQADLEGKVTELLISSWSRYISETRHGKTTKELMKKFRQHVIPEVIEKLSKSNSKFENKVGEKLRGTLGENGDGVLSERQIKRRINATNFP